MRAPTQIPGDPEMLPKRHVLVTGAAGFLGFHLCSRLLRDGWQVTGADRLGQPEQQERLELLMRHPQFRLRQVELADRAAVEALFASGRFDVVVHLAARAGVRGCLEDSASYGESNLTGFLNVIDASGRGKVGHFVYASSSSVYGDEALPFAESDRADRPLNLYAATKRANELMAHAYSRSSGLPCTGLRFFTLYGPLGRPDMAPLGFARAILEGREIRLHGAGEMLRDFLYVEDAVEAMVRLLGMPPEGPQRSRLLNVGPGRPVPVRDFLRLLEERLGRSAQVENVPPQPGELWATECDRTELERLVGPLTDTSLETGIDRMCAWLLGEADCAFEAARPLAEDLSR